MNRATTAAWAAALLFSLAPAAWAADPLAPLGVGSRPAPPPARPVDETLYGTKVTDAYRYMEALDPQTIAWMKAQGAYTRRVLDAIHPLPALKTRTAAFSGSFGFIQSYATYGGRAFYQERAPGSDAFDLMVRQPDGQVRKVIDVAALRAAHGGTPYAINYILPSPDGSKVAAGVSSGGSEDADLFVYDAATGAKIGGPIDRAQFGPTSWSANSKTLYFVRLQQLKPGATPADKYLNVTLDAWDLTSQPVILLGATTGRGPAFSATEAPALEIIPGATVAVLASQNGVQNEIKVWTAPASGAASPDAPWKLLGDRSDGITSLDARGDELFLLSHKDAPTFQVLTLKGGEALAQARVLVPARPDRVVEGVHAAADALYVVVRDGVYSHLLRIPAGSDKAEEVPLPVHGHAGDVFSDSRFPGVIVDMSSWTTQPTLFRYDPAGGRFSEIHVGVRGDMDPAGFQVSDLKARAVDGVEIPLSLIQPKGVTGPQPTVVEAYGAYGISNLADFSTRRAQQMKEGISYAICHVRGGGELGEAWRLGGKDETKPNTWRDLIACGEDLIARGVTTKDRLFIIGGSAGGITMGRAMEERPDLFAGVMDLVPDANSTRSEFMPSGPLNIPEFGTVKTEQGFRNLYEMDAYLHVKPGVAYPAVMITTGLNDPRVAPWEPAKFAAALEAAGAPNPVLLRIDEQAGHGIGSTRTQGDLLSADEIAFVFWRSGREGWRPDAGATQ
ncbi:MAG TPA: prolyl oligopeptidase family serine peptidase [Caulobacteraceae bacterium]|jgi:prolyl oligopeptidase